MDTTRCCGCDRAWRGVETGRLKVWASESLGVLEPTCLLRTQDSRTPRLPAIPPDSPDSGLRRYPFAGFCFSPSLESPWPCRSRLSECLRRFSQPKVRPAKVRPAKVVLGVWWFWVGRWWLWALLVVNYRLTRMSSLTTSQPLFFSYNPPGALSCLSAPRWSTNGNLGARMLS